jgi:hypothetical protein
MGNPFVHVELTTDNTSQAKEFYGQLFSWKLEDAPATGSGGPYTFVKVGEGTGGGMLKKPMPEAPNMWLPYVMVDNVDATIKKARQLGAKVIVEKTPIPEMGAFAIFSDPAGAPLGVWESSPKK